MINLYNTLSRKKETFEPLEDEVRIYTCGPTVYEYAHIGNLRAYIFEDLLKRTLLYNEYKVKHVMNITDVGHLTSDEDTGEDKMEASARKKKKTAWEIADYYTKAFKRDIARLNIKEPDVYVKATDTVKEQIELVKKLEEKGFTYKTSDGVYFDTKKLKSYGNLANLKDIKLKPGARVELGEKKNPTDFALWKFSNPEEKRQMEWDSPWGKGFPGWHTECVVMSEMYLGIPFDIHCGGVDHINVHHTNEIAQGEAVYGVNPAKFWMHGEFLTFEERKMSKSEGDIITLDYLEEEGVTPLSYRYLMLGVHYRTKTSFSIEALKDAKNSLEKLKEKISQIKSPQQEVKSSYKEDFKKAINDDINTPQALALLWKVIRDKNLSDSEKYNLAIDFDKVLGLDLENQSQEEAVPEEITSLAIEREKARKKGDFKESDKIREKIINLGYNIEDTKEGFKLKKL